jgi:hypothetical protein
MPLKDLNELGTGFQKRKSLFDLEETLPSESGPDVSTEVEDEANEPAKEIAGGDSLDWDAFGKISDKPKFSFGRLGGVAWDELKAGVQHRIEGMAVATAEMGQTVAETEKAGIPFAQGFAPAIGMYSPDFAQARKVDPESAWSQFSVGQRLDPDDAKNATDVVEHMLAGAAWVEAQRNPDFQVSSGWIEDQVRTIAQVGTQVASAMIAGPWAAMPDMFLFITGATYDGLVKQGVDPDRARAAALMNATLQAPMESFGVSRVTKFIKPQKAIGKKLRNLIELVGTEFATEYFQNIGPEKLTALWAKNPSQSDVENLQQWWEELKVLDPEAGKEAAMAAVASLIFGGRSAYKAAKVEQANEDYQKAVDEAKSDLDKVRETMEAESGVKTKEKADEETNLTEHEKRKLAEKKAAEQEKADAVKAVVEGDRVPVPADKAKWLQDSGLWDDSKMVIEEAPKSDPVTAREAAKAKGVVNRRTAQDIQAEIDKQWAEEQKNAGGFQPRESLFDAVTERALVPTQQSIVPPKGIEPAEFDISNQLPPPDTQFANREQLDNKMIAGNHLVGTAKGNAYKRKSTAQKKADASNEDPLSLMNAYVVEVLHGEDAGFYLVLSPRQRKVEGPPKIIPDQPGEVIYLPSDIAERTGDRRREALANEGIKEHLMDEDALTHTWESYKKLKGEGVQADEAMTDAEKFAILAEDVNIPELQDQEGYAEMISKLPWAEAVAMPARITYDGTVMTDPGTNNPEHQWIPNVPSKIKSKDITNLHRSWHRAASALESVVPHSDGVNGFIIDSKWFSERFVLSAKNFFNKAAKKQADRIEAESEAARQQALVEQAIERTKEAKRQQYGTNQAIEKAWEDKVTKKVYMTAIRKFRESSPFQSFYAKGWKDEETGRVTPDELIPVAQGYGLDIVADAVRNGKEHPEKLTVLKKKNALIGAIINKLHDHARKEVQQQTGMTEYEVRQRMAQGNLKLPKTGQTRVDEEMDVIENMPDLEEGTRLDDVPEAKIDTEYDRAVRSVRMMLTKAKAKNKEINKFLKDKYGDDTLSSKIPDATILEMGHKFLPRAQFERLMTRVPPEKRAGVVRRVSPYQRKKQIRMQENWEKLLRELNPLKVPLPPNYKNVTEFYGLQGPTSAQVDPVYMTILTGRTYEGMLDMADAEDGEYYQMRVKDKGILPKFYQSLPEAQEAAVALNEEFNRQGDPTRAYRAIPFGNEYGIERVDYELPSNWKRKETKKRAGKLYSYTEEAVRAHKTSVDDYGDDIGFVPEAPVWHATMPGKEYEMRVNQYYALLNTLAKSRVAAFEQGRPWNMQRVLETGKKTYLMDPNYYAYSWQVDRLPPTINNKPTLSRRKPGTKTVREHTINYWDRFLKLKLPKKSYAITGEAALAARNVMPRGNNEIKVIINPQLEQILLNSGHPRLKKQNFGAGGYRWESPDGVIKLIPTRFMRIHRRFGDIRKNGQETKKFLFENIEDVKARYNEKGQQDNVDMITKAMEGEVINPSTDLEYLERAAKGDKAQLGGPSGKILKPARDRVKKTVGDEATGFRAQVSGAEVGSIELEMKEIKTVGLEKYIQVLEDNMKSSGLTQTEIDKLNKFIENQNKFWEDVRHAENRLEQGYDWNDLEPRQRKILNEAKAIKRRDRRNKALREKELAKDRIEPYYIAPAAPNTEKWDDVDEAVLDARARRLYQNNKRRKVDAPLSSEARTRYEELKDQAETKGPVIKKGKPADTIDDWNVGNVLMKFPDGAVIGGVDAGDAWNNAPSKYKKALAKHQKGVRLFKIVGDEDAKSLERIKTPEELETAEADAYKAAIEGDAVISDPDVAVTPPAEEQEPVVEVTPEKQTKPKTEKPYRPSEAEMTLAAMSGKRINAEGDWVDKKPSVDKNVDKDPGKDWALHNGKWIRIPEPDADFGADFYMELITENADRMSKVPGLEEKLLNLDERAQEMEEAGLYENKDVEDISDAKAMDAYNAFDNESGSARLGAMPLTVPILAAIKGVKVVAKALRNKKTYEGMKRYLDVEAAFGKAKEVGFHVKNIFSYREQHYDKFEMSVIKPFQALVAKHLPGARPEHLADVVFAGENATVTDSKGKPIKYDTLLQRVAGKEMYNKNYAPVIEYLRDYFKSARKEYNDRGVDMDWIQRKHDELTQKWEASDRALTKEELDTMQKAMFMLGKLQGMHFVHIPSSMWIAERIHEIVPGNLDDRTYKRKWAKLMEHVSTKREALSLAGMVNNGIIKKEAVNPFEILMHYGYRQAEDFAYYNVRDAMKRAKLIKMRKTKPPRGKDGYSWRAMPQNLQALIGKKPDLKHKSGEPLKTYIREDALGALNAATANIEPRTFVGKGMSMYKMLRFYNPLFLPAYDVIQSVAMGGAANPWEGVKAFKKARYSMKHKDKHYFNAASNGLFSKPFGVPFSDILQKARQLSAGKVYQEGWKGGAQSYIDAWVMQLRDRLSDKKYGKVAQQMAGAVPMAVMHASWHYAWLMDNYVRMYTYHYLKSKDHSDRNAAQFAALIHGDYAGVPARTRRQLNNIFFTPTFKIAMAKAHGSLIKGAYDTATQVGELQKGTAKGRLAGRKALGLLTMIGAQQAFHLVMQNLGFDDEEWGRRYVKTVMTDRGPEEVVFNWSNPMNLFTKYFHRLWNLTFPSPADEHPGREFVKSFLYEFHPVYQTIYRYFENKRFNGDTIWNEFDSEPKQYYDKAAWLFAEEIFPVIGQVNGWIRPKQKDRSIRIAEETMKKEIGPMLELLTRPFTFKYTRSAPDVRFKVQMQQRNKRFQQMIKKKWENGQQVDPQWYRNFVKGQMKLIKEWAEKKRSD